MSELHPDGAPTSDAEARAVESSPSGPVESVADPGLPAPADVSASVAPTELETGAEALGAEDAAETENGNAAAGPSPSVDPQAGEPTGPVANFDLPDPGLGFTSSESILDLPPLATVNPTLYQTPPSQPQPSQPQPSIPPPGYAQNPPPQNFTYTPPNPAQYETYQSPPNYPQPLPYAYQEPPRPAGVESLNWASASHWGTLLGDVFCPVLGSILVPAIIRSSKAQDPYVRQQATEALNFSITMSIGLAISAMLTLILIGFLGFLVIPILVLIFRIQGALAAGRGEPYRYPISIRFVK
ncbi:MAG: DUF4870 domain-containing protein [Propionibacteriaceae bacterium]|nr:DUF4870 domain-containing protein [Propionibacteriaceae bacterium]